MKVRIKVAVKFQLAVEKPLTAPEITTSISTTMLATTTSPAANAVLVLSTGIPGYKPMVIDLNGKLLLS